MRFPGHPRASRAGGHRQDGPARRHGRSIYVRTRRWREPILAGGHPRHVGAWGQVFPLLTNGQPCRGDVSQGPRARHTTGRRGNPEHAARICSQPEDERGAEESSNISRLVSRRGGSRASRLLSVDTYELTEVDPSLPKVVYGCQVVRDLIYGIPPGWQPTLLHPNELMDGAVFRLSNYLASS